MREARTPRGEYSIMSQGIIPDPLEHGIVQVSRIRIYGMRLRRSSLQYS